MREIKFRGYDPIQRRWVYGYLAYENVIATKSGGVVVDSRSVGQYIGRPDKKGVEIYEGDVVTGQGDSIDRRLYQIVWSDKEASFWAKLLTADHDSLQKFVVGQNFSTGVATEVIGNSFENPEPLKLGQSA